MKAISLFLLFLLFLATQVRCYLDIEELQSINYGINIIDQPIVAGGESECCENLNALYAHFIKPDPIPVFNNASTDEFIRLRDLPTFPEDETSLLLKSKFGQNYHCSYLDRRQEDQREMEEERIAMETGIPDLLKPLEDGACLLHTRGWWTYEFCYKNQIRQYHMEDNVITGPIIELGFYESEKDWSNFTPKQPKRSSVSPFHSHLYVNGSVCDLTKKLRKAEVRLSCRKGGSDVLYAVDEPETCSYVFHVHTSRVCSHPYLKPVAQARPVPITCHPVLSQEDFDSYVQHEQERAETLDRIKAERNDQEFKRSREEEAEEVLLESLLQGLNDAFGTEAKLADIKMKTKVVEGQNDFSEAVQEMTKSEEEEEDEEGVTPVEDEYSDMDRKKGETEDDTLTEFQKGLDDILESGEEKEEISKYRDTIESAMNAQFENIIDEAQQELGMEGDKEEMVKELAKTLSGLIKKLEITEKQIREVDEILDDAEEPGSSPMPSYQDTLLNSGPKKRQTAPPPPPPRRSRPPEERSRLALERKLSSYRPNMAKNVKAARVGKIVPKSRKEFDLQERLKGVKTDGRKVEVKILTEFLDESQLEKYKDADGKPIDRIVFAVVTDNDGEIQEQKHQHEMEKAYNFAWGNNKKSKSLPPP